MLLILRLFFVADAAAALIAFWFFFVGLGDGSISSFNMTLWIALLTTVTAITLGGYGLHAKGQRAAAVSVLAILAVPALLAALFFVAVMIMQPRWN